MELALAKNIRKVGFFGFYGFFGFSYVFARFSRKHHFFKVFGRFSPKHGFFIVFARLSPTHGFSMFLYNLLGRHCYFNIFASFSSLSYPLSEFFKKLPWGPRLLTKGKQCQNQRKTNLCKKQGCGDRHGPFLI